MGFDLIETGKRAREAAYILQSLSTDKKNEGLRFVAAALEKNSAKILEANAVDVKVARDRGTTDAMIDRLALDEKRIKDLADGVRGVCDLPDPIGEVLSKIVIA